MSIEMVIIVFFKCKNTSNFLPNQQKIDIDEN
jgi:hypothetical protein